MRIFLAGVSCVGKTTVGAHLAALRGVPFFDLDTEVEQFFQRPIARIQGECITMESYRRRASEVLAALLAQEHSLDGVIALPPSGLMGSYRRIVKTAKGIVVVLTDTPENIVERIAFYDQDSRPVHKVLSSSEKRWYVSDIRKDIAYFGRSYKKADVVVEVAGLSPSLPDHRPGFERRQGRLCRVNVCCPTTRESGSVRRPTN
jgi:shikimate kinase